MAKTAQLAQIGGIPVLILKEGSQRAFGREALRMNIMAARAVAEALRATLGPKGMDKMLIDALGDITITNDGATILKEMEVQHPVAKLLVEIARAQEDEVGDGTTSVIVLAGELLRAAEELVDKNIHPTVIVSGYKKALQKAIEVLNKIAIPVDIKDRETLKKIAATAIQGKVLENVRDFFAEMAVDAVLHIAEVRNGKYYVDLDNVQIVKKHGGSLLDSKIVYGVIIDKEVVHPGMPKRVTNAKIALLDAPLEVEKPEIDAEIRISSPEKLKAFLEEEEKLLREMVEKIRAVGANVVFTTKGIDEIAQHYLAKYGIMAVRRVKKSDIEKLARATGARIVTNIEELTPEDLGEAGLVEERKVGDEKMVFVEQCKHPKAVAILIRGGLEKVVDEAERNLDDALSVVADVLEEPKVVPAGGAVEIEIAKALREYAPQVGGREQLAIEAFADAIEVIPKAIAENAGLDAVEILVKLRAKHNEKDGWRYGLNVYKGEIVDMVAEGYLEPVSVKRNILEAAVEAASMILRIDDIIAAAPTKEEKKKKGGEEEEESKPSFE